MPVPHRSGSFSVLPVSSLGLDHKVFDERISSGIADLDAMLSGGGFHRASSTLVSAVAGAGAHSNQVREFIMSNGGIKLVPPYLGESGALTGSARKNEEAKTRRAEMRRRAELSKAQQQAEQKRRRARARMEALQAELDADEIELKAMTQTEDDYLRQSENT